MKFLVIAISLLLCLSFVHADKKKVKQNDEGTSESNSTCTTIFNQTSPLIKPALLLGDQKWPTTLDAINKHCELGTAVYKGIRRYGKCLSGISRQALNIFMRGLKKYMQNICSSSKKKLDTAETLKCASKETVTGWSKCLNQANQRLDVTAKNASDPAMVGNICCTYSAVLGCVAQNTGTSAECNKKYDPSKFFQSSVQLVLKDLIELLCTNYESKEACVTHDAERADVLKSIDGNYTAEGAFILSPLMKAASQLGEIHADDL